MFQAVSATPDKILICVDLAGGLTVHPLAQGNALHEGHEGSRFRTRPLGRFLLLEVEVCLFSCAGRQRMSPRMVWSVLIISNLNLGLPTSFPV